MTQASTPPSSSATATALADVTSMVDWKLAESTALRLVPNGPQASPDEAHEVVDGLRAAAVEAVEHIDRTVQMTTVVEQAPVRVVDRATWVRLNIEDIACTLTPVMDVMSDRRRRRGSDEGTSQFADAGTVSDSDIARDNDAAAGRAVRLAQDAGSTVVSAIGSRATGFQVGSLLAYVGTKVLGQHELFTPAERAPQLLLVAPNILVAERTLGVDPAAFRMWVCLHEQTHRVQLAAVPWLRDHIEADLQKFMAAADTDGAALRERFGAMVSSTGGAVRGERGRSLLEAVQTPEQREILDRLVALMTLLEGHADWAMDQVDDDVVANVAQVRARFEKRRDGAGAMDQVLRRLFGLDQKLAQYREGSRFVRDVVERVGVEGLNAVWTSADTLPMRAEIDDPTAWVDRVHGTRVQ